MSRESQLVILYQEVPKIVQNRYFQRKHVYENELEIGKNMSMPCNKWCLF